MKKTKSALAETTRVAPAPVSTKKPIVKPAAKPAAKAAAPAKPAPAKIAKAPAPAKPAPAPAKPAPAPAKIAKAPAPAKMPAPAPAPVAHITEKTREKLVERRLAPLKTPSDLKPKAAQDISAAMNGVLADVYALYFKTKNFHWHVSGPHFRDYHLLLDEQGDQIFAMGDPIAERIRKLGGQTIKSVGDIARRQKVLDNDADFVEPSDMIAELGEDNKALASRLRTAHVVCEKHNDIATTSLIEVWIDETERRTWFLFETSRRADSGGH